MRILEFPAGPEHKLVHIVETKHNTGYIICAHRIAVEIPPPMMRSEVQTLDLVISETAFS